MKHISKPRANMDKNFCDRSSEICYTEYNSTCEEVVNVFETHFFETMLDNFSEGIYILDDAGNYIFVNSAYSKLLNMSKSVLLTYNVHDFLTTGQIDLCISDIVYREKRQVVMFQDVWDTQGIGRSAIRQIVTSTPIFDEVGQVQNILAVVQPLDKFNDLYQQAVSKKKIIYNY